MTRLEKPCPGSRGMVFEKITWYRTSPPTQAHPMQSSWDARSSGNFSGHSDRCGPALHSLTETFEIKSIFCVASGKTLQACKGNTSVGLSVKVAGVALIHLVNQMTTFREI